METLIEKLGLDWKLLLAQAANFLIVLAVLRFTVYKPLLRMLSRRRHEIEAGILKSKEADVRLHQISELHKEKTEEANREAAHIVTQAVARAKTEEARLLELAAGKEAEIMLQAAKRADTETEKARAKVESEAADLVRRVLIQAVQIAPEHVDEALIAKVAKNRFSK